MMKYLLSRPLINKDKANLSTQEAPVFKGAPHLLSPPPPLISFSLIVLISLYSGIIQLTLFSHQPWSSPSPPSRWDPGSTISHSAQLPTPNLKKWIVSSEKTTATHIPVNKIKTLIQLKKTLPSPLLLPLCSTSMAQSPPPLPHQREGQYSLVLLAIYIYT